MSLFGFRSQSRKVGEKRRRRSLSGVTKRSRLGAIEEEHLTYELPDKELEGYFFKQHKNWGAYCSPNAVGLIWETLKTVPEKVRNDPQSSWNVFRRLVNAEVAQLNPSGTGKNPPICIMRPASSEKVTPLYQKSATKHERFHARAENIRRAFGVSEWGDRFRVVIPAMDKILTKDFGQPAKDAIKIAKKAKWTTGKLDNAEEILARAEEIIEDCSYDEDAATCGFARRRYRDWVDWYNNRLKGTYEKVKNPDGSVVVEYVQKGVIPLDTFDKLSDELERRYHSAPDYYIDAMKRITGRNPDKLPTRQRRISPSERSMRIEPIDPAILEAAKKAEEQHKTVEVKLPKPKKVTEPKKPKVTKPKKVTAPRDTDHWVETDENGDEYDVFLAGTVAGRRRR